jgi:hypothetical protein
VDELKPATMEAIFREKPQQWGLRGDPSLWVEMKRRLKTTPLPVSPEAARAIVEGVFAMLTGHPISEAEAFFIERYSHGGMSSGYISPEFWRECAMPLLLSRYQALVATADAPDDDHHAASVSIDPSVPMQELKAVLARHDCTFDEPEAIPLMAHVRAAGLLADGEWQQISVWLDEAMRYLAGTESGETAEHAYENEQEDWSPEDDKDEDEEEVDCIDSPDADPRNADWIRIVGARRRSGYMLPSWAGLWLWWIGHDRMFDEWWGPIGELARSLGIRKFEADR